MPSRPVKAHMLVKLYDGDEAKTKKLRRRIVGAALVRRDEHGQKVVDSRITKDKGKPPKQPKPPKPTPRAPRDRTVERARRQAELEAEIEAAARRQAAAKAEP